MAEETKTSRSPPAAGADTGASSNAPAPPSEHLNIKVTDNNNEVFFKIKHTTQLKKLMEAFCDRQGKQPSTVRFLFDGMRVQADDTPQKVCHMIFSLGIVFGGLLTFIVQLDMADGDTLEAHQEQIGGGC